MNTGRLSLICWVLFLVGVLGVDVGLTEGGGDKMAIGFAILAGLSFVYAMYLGLMAMRKGDPWLRRRGESATAEILSGTRTRWAMAAGEYYGIGAPFIWKYRLEVTKPGHSPYKTTLYICAELGEGGTIPVKVSRLNRWRVTFDPEAAGGSDPAEGRAVARERAIREAVAGR